MATKHLLLGLLAEGENFALRVLQALEVDLDQLHDEADRLAPEESGSTGTPDAPAKLVIMNVDRLRRPGRWVSVHPVDAVTGGEDEDLVIRTHDRRCKNQVLVFPRAPDG